MDNKAGSDVSGEKKGLVWELAAGLYYKESGTGKQFESLTKEETKPWIAQAVSFLECIDKMNFLLTLKAEQNKIQKTDADKLEVLTQLIAKFVNKLDVVKKELFPAAELAHLLLNVDKSK